MDKKMKAYEVAEMLVADMMDADGMDFSEKGELFVKSAWDAMPEDEKEDYDDYDDFSYMVWHAYFYSDD